MRRAQKKTTAEPRYECEWDTTLHWLDLDAPEAVWHNEESHSYTEDFDVDNKLLSIQLFQYRQSSIFSSFEDCTFLLFTSENGLLFLVEKSERNISIEYASSLDALLSKMGKNIKIRPHAKTILKDNIIENFTFETFFELFLDEERKREYDSVRDNGLHFAQRMFNGCAKSEHCELVPCEKPLDYRPAF